MCKFKSGIVLRSEGDKGGFRLLMSPWTESHEDLITIHKLKDTKLNFARVEFKPPSLETADKVETYKLSIDERLRPEWFDAEMEETVSARMADYIRSIIVTGEVCLLIGGQFILATGAKIGTAKACIVNAMGGSSTIEVMCGSSKVEVMRGSSTVGDMGDFSNVGVMGDSSNVEVMRGSSNVGGMYDSSTVGEMRDSSNVGVMRDSSNVGGMYDSSTVGDMGDSSNVEVMCGSSNVEVMRGSSTVGEMYDSSNVGVIGTGKITTDYRSK